ncbi:MAG: hypothetical protein JXA07_12740 [Spirochaetes bacterium]|nr:hypothetical protein [Spirochaetota bacterium]
MNRLKTEFDRFLVREDKLADLAAVKPLVNEQHDKALAGLNRFMDRVSGIRRMQKYILDVVSIIDGIDFHVRQSTKKERGQENIMPEHLAIQKLAAHLGASKVRRVDTGEIVRVNFLDDYKGLADRRTLFFFSSTPKPGVYSFPLDTREISTKAVYEPITLEEKKK